MPALTPRKCPRQPIRPDAVYPLACFRLFTGMGQKAIRAAQRRGLRVVVDGNRRFVRGRDFITYIDRLADEQEVPT